jgi:predicted CXXCH cytochrome family protein
MNFRTCVALAPLVISGCVLTCHAVFAEESCVSEKCHATLLKGATVHAVAESCSACHESVDTPHPQKGKKTFKLTQGLPDLCTTCHPAIVDKGHVHFPVAQGMCTACHNPHASNEPKLLTAAGQHVCLPCHPQIADKINDSRVAHPALMTEQACIACHSPHSSNYEDLLLKPVKDTCVTCHDSVIPNNATVLHGPNNDGKCTRCHDPHGSQYDTLLVNQFPSGNYVPYTETAYPLCFGCHQRDMVDYAETSYATNFRDGERNLHYVHVHKSERGRSCKLCHSFHGSPNPELIADTVPFGNWNLPLRFVKTDTGGGCSPGCHKPQHYDRKSPAEGPTWRQLLLLRSDQEGVVGSFDATIQHLPSARNWCLHFGKATPIQAGSGPASPVLCLSGWLHRRPNFYNLKGRLPLPALPIGVTGVNRIGTSGFMTWVVPGD